MQPPTDRQQCLRSVAGAIREKVTRLTGRSLNEETTKTSLIIPLLSALGWDTTDPEEVHCEYRRLSKDTPVDYAMLLQRTPCLFLEAKSLGEDLGDRRWTNQAISYATQAGVGWVILSNGVDYHVYNAHAAVPLERKLFKQLSMTETPVEELVHGFALLHREEFVGKRIDRAWDAHHTDAQVRTAIETLFSPAGSKPLAKLIATVTTPTLPVADIVAPLTRADVRVTYPPPPLPSEDVVKASARTPKAKPATALPADVPPPVSPRRGGLAELIAVGVLRARTELVTDYMGHTITARVLDGGDVEMNSVGTRWRCRARSWVEHRS